VTCQMATRDQTAPPLMSKLQFETPENVRVNFSLAGLGTRYVAWFVDQILVMVAIFAILMVMACAGTSFHGVEKLFKDLDGEDSSEAAMYVFGLAMLIWGLGSFFYFGLCELMLRGQTPGKRLVSIRVAKADGFSLDGAGILTRNVFRVLDHIPLLWIVPLLSARSQRIGDLVAGTVVISDAKAELSSIRVELAERSALESEFRFDAAGLSKLTENDLQAVEKLLERWNSIPQQQRHKIARTVISSLMEKLNVERPDPASQVRFLEDLLAAELRRQQRGLG
jgi:uncharacterized RDD family membrane protein YckC